MSASAATPLRLTSRSLAEHFEEFLAEQLAGQPCTPNFRQWMQTAYYAGAMEGAFEPRLRLREVIEHAKLMGSGQVTGETAETAVIQ